MENYIHTKTTKTNFEKELHLRIALSQAMAGALYSELDLLEVIRIVREVASDYEREWKEETAE